MDGWMFRDFIRVEIELHSHCNRRCPWCTNAYRNRPYTQMSDETFSRVLKELKGGNFESRISHKDQKFITLNGYSEPFSKPDILLRRVDEILEVMPKVDVSVNTNGDFLDADFLTQLRLSRLAIMDYDCKGQDYWIERFKELGILLVSNRGNIITGTHRSITQVVVRLDWPINFEIENRAGFLPRKITSDKVIPSWVNGRKRRTDPCVEPLYFPTINSDGSVMMCCHMRADTHKKYILGNVNNQSLEEIFTSDKYVKLRDIFKEGDVDKYPKECLHCHKNRDMYFATIDRRELAENYNVLSTNKNRMATRMIQRTDYEVLEEQCFEKKDTTS